VHRGSKESGVRKGCGEAGSDFAKWHGSAAKSAERTRWRRNRGGGKQGASRVTSRQ